MLVLSGATGGGLDACLPRGMAIPFAVRTGRLGGGGARGGRLRAGCSVRRSIIVRRDDGPTSLAEIHIPFLGLGVVVGGAGRVAHSRRLSGPEGDQVLRLTEA